MSESEIQPETVLEGLERSPSPTIQPVAKPERPKAPEKAAETGKTETYESVFGSLPTSLQEKLTPEILNQPDKYSEGSTPGKRELMTYLKLLYYSENGLPSADENTKVRTVVFIANPLPISVNSEVVRLNQIIGVENGNFICEVTGEKGKQKVEVPASTILEVQRQIVEQNSETGIIKTSALRTFLEKQKYPQPDGGQLSESQQKFNEEIDKYTKKLEDQLIASPQEFSEAMTLVLVHRSETEFQEEMNKIQNELDQLDPSSERAKELEKIKELLQQIKESPKEKIKEQMETLRAKIDNGQLTPQQIDEINNLMVNNRVDPESFTEKFLKEEEGDSEETKNKKNKVREALKNAPIIGGVIGIFLLLIILQSAKQSGSGGGMMG